MGYYTSYSITIKNVDEFPENVYHDILKVSTYGEDDVMLSHSSIDTAPIKWYDAIEDMIEISKKYPSYIFEIYGDGEESDDYWKQYIQNGKTQNANLRFIWDEFDENKLQEWT